MTALTIHRLQAEVRDDLDQADPARVERLLRLVADRALEESHPTYGALDGEWCVQRLDLDLDVAPDEPDLSAAARWAALIAGAIRDLVPDGSNVLHFRSRSRLLLDLVLGVVAGDPGRTWAWRQAGLLSLTDPDPKSQPGAALVAALAREPRLAVPVLSRAVQQAGVPAVHAVLGQAGWEAVADLVRPGWRAVAGFMPDVRSRPGRQHRAEAALAGSALAQAMGASASGYDLATQSALAVLVLAEVDPAAGAELLPWIAAGLVRVAPEPPPGLSERTTAVAETTPGPSEPAAAAAEPAAAWFGPGGRPTADGDRDLGFGLDPAGRSSTPGGFRPLGEHQAGLRPGRPDLSSPAASATHIDTPTSRGEAARQSRPQPSTSDPIPLADPVLIDNPVLLDKQGAVPLDTEPESGVATHWAGLLFVLNAAATAGFPDAIEADVRLTARPLRWVLHSLALRLIPVRADDPAALALAGLTPTMPAPAGPPPEPIEEQALAQHAAQWADTVEQVLEQARHPHDDTPVPTLWSLARRPGRIVADPGWLEVQLDLDDIDLLVRRAGLDLDPGWLDWLGTVVVFRYV